VKTLHDDDDCAPRLVVEATVERAVEPFVGGDPPAFRHGVGGFERIVDQDEIGAAAGEHAPDRGRHPRPTPCGDEFLQRRAGRGEPRREQALIPGRYHDRAAVARELVGKQLAVGHIDDGEGRVVTKQPGGQRDRGGERFQMPRRDVDDEPPDSSVAHRLKLGRQQLDVPAPQEASAGVQFEKAPHQEGMKVRAQGGLIFSR